MPVTLRNVSGLGTKWGLQVYDEVDPDALQDFLETQIREFESLYSRFDPDSLLSKLNRTKVLEDAPDDLLQMLRLGLEYHELSGGLFNLATDTHQRAQGYDADYSLQDNPTLTPRTIPFDKAISIADTTITLHPDATLDLGGIGKGYLIDKISKLLRDRLHLPHFLLNGGGDIYATSHHGQPIPVHLQYPTKPNKSLGQIYLQDESLCASSPHLRRWRDKTHLLNPLDPMARVTRSSFVRAPDATTADILATLAVLIPEPEFAEIAGIKHAMYRII